VRCFTGTATGDVWLGTAVEIFGGTRSCDLEKERTSVTNLLALQAAQTLPSTKVRQRCHLHQPRSLRRASKSKSKRVGKADDLSTAFQDLEKDQVACIPRLSEITHLLASAQAQPAKGTMPSTLGATTAYAAHTLAILSLFAATTIAHAHSPHFPSRSNLSKRGLATMTYEGCYSSSSGLTDQGSYTYQTSGYCQPICVKQNQAVLATSGGSDCWCGDVLPPADSKVDDSNCNTPCNGYGSENCTCKTNANESMMMR